MAKWSKSKSEWLGRAGWGLLAHLALKDEELPDEFFGSQLELIQREIHHRKNRVRDAMNSALIAIGIRNSKLKKGALAAAAKIGTVAVNHGQTGCKTPDASEYIQRTWQRKRQRKK
jgi:hypothetical protein